MENLFGIGILLDYQDRASAKMLKTQRIFSQTQQTAEQLAEAVEKNNEKFKKLAGISAGVALAGAGLKASGGKLLGVLGKTVEETKSFETALVNLKIVSGETEEGMERLKKIAIETGMATMFSPQETVDALTSLAAAGLDVESSLTALRPTLDLVSIAAGKIELAEGASLIASSLNKFNLEASEAVRLVDMFVKVSNLTNFQLEDMSAFINSLGTAPAKLGRPMEELLAMGGLLRNIGQGAAQAGATVQGFGRQLIMITQQLERGKGMKVDALKELGISAEDFWDAEGKMKSMMEIFERLTEASANLTDEKRATLFQRIFGDQAGNMLNAVMRSTEAFMKLDEATGQYVSTSTDGKRAFQDIVEGLKDSVGVSKQASEDILDTLWGIQKINEGIKQTFQVLLGQTVIPIIGKVTKFFSNLLSKIVEFGYAHPVFMKTLGFGLGLAGLALTAVGTLLVLGGALGGAIAGLGLLQGKVATLATSWLGLNANMLTGTAIMNALWLKMRPLLTQMGAIAVTLGALYLAWKVDFGGIRTIITDFIDNTRHAFTEARQIIGLNTDEMLTALRRLEQEDDFFSKLTLAIIKVDTLWKGLTEAWNDYTLSEDTFVRLRELGLLPIIETILDLKMKFEAFWEGLRIGFEGVSTVVSTVFGTVIWWIEKAIGFLKDLLFPTQEVKDEVAEVNDVVGGINTDGWKNFGKAVGIVGGLLLTYKIASIVWGIVTALGSFGKTLITETIPNIWKFVAGMGAKAKAMLIDKAETIYLMGLYAKEGIAKGLLTAKTWLLTGATKALGVAQGAVNALFVASPIGWVILAIVALVGVIYLLIKHWDKVKEAVLGFVESSIKWLKGLCEGIKMIFAPVVEFFSGLWNGIKEFAMGVWNNFLAGLGVIYEGVMAVWTPIKEWFSGLWTGIKETASTIWGGILEFIEGIVDGVKTAWDTLTGFFSGLWDGIKETAKVFFDWIEEKFGWVSNITDKVKGVFSGVADGVKSGVGKVVGGAKKLVGLSTGGYVKEQGIAVLHPNEVVVNDKVTEMLKTFLLRNKEGEIS
ncbi:MAG TPA: phage tail tape measure protein, partial [Thermodesulfovibrio thiophilus]|nr:phage tail tape measure protein [Thermodesulfovibrio thiophilus]